MGQKWNILPIIVMVVVTMLLAGLNVFYKLAANDGMSLKIMLAYRFLFAAAFMVPLAFVVERGKRPKLTRVVVLQAFFCALLGGSLAQNLYAETLILTSATFASAITNLIPTFTFIMALAFRMEILNIKTWPGKAKVTGMLVSLSGGLLLTLYKGKIVIWSTSFSLLKGNQSQPEEQHFSKPALGSLLGIISCLTYALSLIIQSKMSERYPCPYSSTALIAVMGAIQSFIFARLTENTWRRWELGWNIRLLSVAYAGIIASGVTVIISMWCIQKRGPLFVSLFNPLMLVFTAIAASLVLDENLHLGSVVGSVLIIGGLYVVLLGKSKDIQRKAIISTEAKLGEFQKLEILVSSSSSSSEKEIRKCNEVEGINPKAPIDVSGGELSPKNTNQKDPNST